MYLYQLEALLEGKYLLRMKNMQVLKIKHDIDMNLITIGYEKNH